MTLNWVFFLLYAAFTARLAWAGRVDASTPEGFARGSGRMHWTIAGVTLGACLASSSTFVIVPGFVYREGMAALIGSTLPLLAGLALGLGLTGARFQAFGASSGALTIPHWLGARYESEGLRKLFSAFNLLNIAYLVLVVVGAAYVMQAALGLPYLAAVIGVVTFVFAYTAIGGATAHAFTNTAQGLIMLAVAGGIGALCLARVDSWGPDLLQTGLVAPDSPLFGSLGEVLVLPLLVGLMLATQPHLLSKALYVETRRDWTLTAVLGVACFAVFSLVLLAGADARTQLGAGIPQDQVMARWLSSSLPGATVRAVVNTAVLAAAMSTLDGLLVAISASVTGDLLGGRGGAKANAALLALLGVVTIALAASPPKLVLLFGQVGVYGLVAAGAGPLLAGLWLPGRLPAGPAFASALLALATHLIASTWWTNPGLSAVTALAVGLPVAFLPALFRRPAAVASMGALHARHQ